MSRVAWDEESYPDLVRRACFICEMPAGNPTSRTTSSTAKHVVGDFPLDDRLAPLPPGVPCEQQQFAAFSPELGSCDFPSTTSPRRP
ncbi:hypothetical protein ACRAKI_14765 [Saccharothrix isguenensis]